MEKIKVSIVIPIYNASKYLNKCLESVINQTYQNIEIILVDDGSKDNSGEICDVFAKKDNRIIVIHQKNCGVSTARNNGIKKASGKYVSFIDSDDMVHPDYITKLVNKLDGNNLSICQIDNFHDSVIYDDNERETIKLDKIHFIELCKFLLLNTPCCKLYDMNIINKNNIYFDSNLSLGEDLLFNLVYLKYVDNITITNQKLYYYRKDENSTLSTVYNPKMFDIQLLLFDKFVVFFKDIPMDKNGMIIFDSYKFSTLKIIVENEFRNKKVNFIKRYLNVRTKISDERFKKRIKSIRYPNKKFICFLIKHKLILSYKIINKISSII